MGKIILIGLICLSILLIFQTKIFAANLITNPGFEMDDTSWVKNTSTIDFSFVKDEAIEGTRSAKIINNKTSSFGIEQTILNINPSQTYIVSAFVKPIILTDKAYLRIAWYKTLDGSGSQFSTDDSSIASPSAQWQKLEIVKQPSDGVFSAKIRLLVATGSAYFDNVLFDQYITPSQTPTPSPSPTSAPTPTITPMIATTPLPTSSPTSYDKIYLSELMVSPDTGQKEWVEFYNDNDFDVVLTNWFIDDLENSGSTPKSFSLNVKAKSYTIYDLSSSMFNNDGDSVRLMDFNKRELDSFEYGSSQKGKSLGRTSFDNDSFCPQEPTKGLQNGPCLNLTPKPSALTNQTKPPSLTDQIPSPTSKLNPITSYYDANQLSSENLIASQSDNEIPQGEVLGIESDSSSQTSPKVIAKTLSFASFSYSLLTIFSLLLKMKMQA